MATMVYPVGTVTNAQGHIEIGGCDVVELAAEFGTPAYLFSVEEMRNRARAYQDAFAAHTDNFEVLFASKALPVTAAYRLFAEEGLSVEGASGGELTLAPNASRFDVSLERTLTELNLFLSHKVRATNIVPAVNGRV